MKLETRQLRYFVAVAEELHFGRAALRLHLSQPPLSQQIRQLEEGLGVLLFERTQRSVRITHAGSVLLSHAREALGKLDEAVLEVRAAARGDAGFIACGYTAASAYSLVPALIHAFNLSHPRVQVLLHESPSNEQLRSLVERRLDVALVRPITVAPGLTIEKLLEERLVAALPIAHPLASQAVVDVKDLHGQAFIGFTTPGSRYFHDMIEGIFGAAGVTPVVVQRATQLHSVVALVSAGLGLALVPDASARVHMERVVYRPLRSESLPRPELHLCWRTEDLTPLVGNFIASAREVVSKDF